MKKIAFLIFAIAGTAAAQSSSGTGFPAVACSANIAGQNYADTLNNLSYKCVNITGTGYVWQQGNSPVLPVASAPSGACTSSLPNQQVTTTGVQYSCQGGTWAAIGGSGSGTVNPSTTGKLAYYAADGTAVSGNAATVGASGNFITPLSANVVSRPSYAPATYIAFGDSISTCSVQVTTASNCYVNHLAIDLGLASNLPTANRALTGDESADVVWRIQSADNPAVAGKPNFYTLMIGTNDADQHGAGPTTWEANYKLFHQAALAWLAIPSSGKVAGSTATPTGTCANDTTFSLVTGQACTANASTLTFSAFPSVGGVVYIFYRSISTDAGTWTYAVDGGTPVSVNTAPPINFTTVNSHTSSMGVIRVTGVTAGSHSIAFAQTHAGTMSILAVGSLPTLTFTSLPHVASTDVINQLDGTKAAATAAYAADAQADIALLTADNLNVVLAPANALVQATTAAADMGNTLHPNDTGHLEIYRAFQASSAIKPSIPSVSVPPAVSFDPYGNPLVTQSTAAAGSGATISAKNTLNSSSGHAEIVLTSGASSAGTVTQLCAAATCYWDVGMLGGVGAGKFLLYDLRNSHAVMDLPTNTMPAESYGGNATGPLLGGITMQATLYSAAGTALPSCAAGTKGGTAIVSDATTPTYLATYASGGAVVAPVMCNGTNWVTY